MRRFELPLFNEKICSRYVTQKYQNDPRKTLQPRIGEIVNLAAVEELQKLRGFLRCRKTLAQIVKRQRQYG